DAPLRGAEQERERAGLVADQLDRLVALGHAVIQQPHRLQRAAVRGERGAVAVRDDDDVAFLAADGGGERRVGGSDEGAGVVRGREGGRLVGGGRGLLLDRRGLGPRGEEDHPHAEDERDQQDAGEGAAVGALFLHGFGAGAAGGTGAAGAGFAGDGEFTRRAGGRRRGGGLRGGGAPRGGRAGGPRRRSPRARGRGPWR